MTKKKQYPKYTLTFFLRSEKGKEILEEISCDFFSEVCDEAIPKIFCLDVKRDIAVGYPAINLRRIIQNYGLDVDKNNEEIKNDNSCGGIYS